MSAPVHHRHCYIHDGDICSCGAPYGAALAPTTPRTIADLDRPLPELEAAVRTIAAHTNQAAGLAAEWRHQLEPAVDAFTVMACMHPECCSTAADYPGWVPPHLDTPERAA